jgi:hypothetical protein
MGKPLYRADDRAPRGILNQLPPRRLSAWPCDAVGRMLCNAGRDAIWRLTSSGGGWLPFNTDLGRGGWLPARAGVTTYSRCLTPRA